MITRLVDLEPRDTSHKGGRKKGHVQRFKTKNRIQEELDNQGETQARLAEAVGINPSQVSHLALGRHQPHVGLALRIAAAMRVPVEDLFYE